MLIPRDIVSIKLGDIILADACLLEGDTLKIDLVNDLIKKHRLVIILRNLTSSFVPFSLLLL